MIELKNVSKIYGKEDAAVNALRNINITIKDGEFVAIIGPSGSGKSTLLNILGGIDNPTSGEYYLNEGNIATLKNKKIADIRNVEFGFVLQYFGLVNDYSVYENVMLPLRYSSKYKGSDRKKRVNKMIEDMGLKDKAKKYPTELSGGQCQRVAIARALVNNPNIIFADEPTGALDRATGDQIFDILRELNKEGKTVVIVSHDENIFSKCDRVIKIEDGQVISDSKGDISNEKKNNEKKN